MRDHAPSPFGRMLVYEITLLLCAYGVYYLICPDAAVAMSAGVIAGVIVLFLFPDVRAAMRPRENHAAAGQDGDGATRLSPLLLAALFGLMLLIQGTSVRLLEGGPAADSLSGEKNVWSFLYPCLIAPLGEETVYRLYFAGALRPYGRKTAIGVSALFFSLIHRTPAQMAAGLLSGAVLGFAFFEYPAPCVFLMHMLCNGIAMLPCSFFLCLAAGGLAAVYFIFRGRKGMLRLRKRVPEKPPLHAADLLRDNAARVLFLLMLARRFF